MERQESDDPPPPEHLYGSDETDVKQQRTHETVISTYHPTLSAYETKDEGDLSESYRENLMNHNDYEDQGTYRSVVTKRTYQDIAFTILFALCFTVMIILAIVYQKQGKEVIEPIQGSIPNLIFYTITSSYGMIAIIVFLSFILGLVWALSLRFLIKKIVWFTLFFVPISLFIVSIWCFVDAAIYSHLGNAWTIVNGIVSLILCILFVIFVLFSRKQINSAIIFLELSCEVMKDYPSVFIVSLLTSLMYIVFVVFWAWSFSWTFLIGYAEPLGGEYVWHPSSSSYGVMTFLIFIFFWTSSLFGYIQNYILCEITCFWYFNRNEPTSKHRNIVKEAFIHSVTTSFGTLCFASLVVALFRLLRFISSRILLGNSKKRNCCTNLCLGCLESLVRLADTINKYAISYAALTGESFCASSKATFGIFKRNLLDRVMIGTIAQIVLFVWTLTLSLIFSMGVFSFTATNLGSSNGWIPSLISIFFSFFTLRFFSEVVLTISDSLFLCYSIDCDSSAAMLSSNISHKNHLVHQTFESICRPNQTIVVYDAEEL